jgi:hypothetical protein
MVALWFFGCGFGFVGCVGFGFGYWVADSMRLRVDCKG